MTILILLYNVSFVKKSLLIFIKHKQDSQFLKR